MDGKKPLPAPAAGQNKYRIQNVIAVPVMTFFFVL